MGPPAPARGSYWFSGPTGPGLGGLSHCAVIDWSGLAARLTRPLLYVAVLPTHTAVAHSFGGGGGGVREALPKERRGEVLPGEEQYPREASASTEGYPGDYYHIIESSAGCVASQSGAGRHSWCSKGAEQRLGEGGLGGWPRGEAGGAGSGGAVTITVHGERRSIRPGRFSPHSPLLKTQGRGKPLR